MGKRVGTLSHTDQEAKEVHFFGYGEHVGDEVPGEDAEGFAAMLRVSRTTNPKIVLDSGEVVWGCECWWGPEEVIKAKLENLEGLGFTIQEVSVKDHRERQREGG